MFKGIGAGLGALGNLGEIMKQAQEMQTRMAEMQQRIEVMTADGQAGGGLVRANVTARGRVMGLTIDPSLFREEEKAVLEDLIRAAINDARDRAEQMAQAELQKMTAGMPLPPGFKL